MQLTRRQTTCNLYEQKCIHTAVNLCAYLGFVKCYIICVKRGSNSTEHMFIMMITDNLDVHVLHGMSDVSCILLPTLVPGPRS